MAPSPQDSSATRDPKIFFLHIPKTAGMSLNGLFVRNYRGRPHYNVQIKDISEADWLACLDRMEKTPREELDQYQIFKGHMIYGLHKFVPGPAEYITFLRDPVKRLISHYKMVRRQNMFSPDHQIDPSRSDWNLGAYPAFIRSLDNYQTRALSGMDFQIPFGGCSEEHLKLAMDNMDRDFKFVGLTEQFDLSLLLLRRVCGWGWRYYSPDNVAPETPVPISTDVIDALRRLNRFDLALYRHAQERFDRLVDQYGWKLQVELKVYGLGNRMHQGLHRGKAEIGRKPASGRPG